MLRKVMLLTLATLVVAVFVVPAAADFYVLMVPEACSAEASERGYEWDEPALGMPYWQWGPQPYDFMGSDISHWWEGAEINNYEYGLELQGNNYLWFLFTWPYRGYTVGDSNHWYQYGRWGEKRVMAAYDLMGLTSYHENGYPFTGNFRVYDPVATGVGPDQVQVSDGWGFGGDWMQTTGPTKCMFQYNELSACDDDGLQYALWPVHLQLDNTTAWSGGIYSLYDPGLPQIKRVMMGTAFTTNMVYASTMSQIADDKQFEIVHEMPPMAQEGYMSGDMIWGLHSGEHYDNTQWDPPGSGPGGRELYWDLVVSRFSVGEIDDADPGAWGTEGLGQAFFSNVRYNTCAVPNNYPVGRECATGYWVIDVEGRGTDDEGAMEQNVYHGPGDDVDDPLIYSFAHDLFESRQFSHFIYKAYNLTGYDLWLNDVGGAWGEELPNYLGLFYYYTNCQSGLVMLRLGDAVTAEDWVLYK